MLKMIQHILTDAVEGPGIAYWARLGCVARDKEDNVEAFIVHDGAPDGDVVKKGYRLITEAVILRTRNKIINGEGDVRRDIAAQFVGKPDQWEYDSEGIDALIQVAFFGKTTYG